MNEQIKKARNFAISKHGNQKYGENDYAYHLDQVYEIGLLYDLSLNELTAIYLHDILEDTTTKKEEIIKEFGEDVYELVYAVTGIGENRKERKNSVIEKLKKFPKAINIKICDRIANINNSKNNNNKLFQMYLKEAMEYEVIFKLGKKELFEKITLLINEPIIINKKLNRN